MLAPVVALAALFLSLYHTYLSALALTKDQLAEQQLLLARQTVVAIRKSLDSLVRELRWLASHPAIRSGDVEAFATLAEDTFRYVRGAHVNDVALLDAAGVVRLPLRAPQLAGKDLSYRTYFQKARAADRSFPAYELITFQGVAAGGKGIVIAMPVLSDDGAFGGVVLFTIVVAELMRGLSEPKPVGIRSWVVDNRGHVIFHPVFPTGTRLGELPEAGMPFKAFVATAASGQTAKAEYVSPDGRPTIAACFPIAIAGETWSYVVTSDVEVARDLLRPFTVDYGWLTATAFLFVLVGSAALFWRFHRWNRELEETVLVRTRDLKQHREQLRSLAAELSLTEARERRHIATELHDRIGQSLAVVSLRLGALGESVAATAAEGQLAEVRKLVKRTIEDTRSLTFELSPPVLHQLGLEAAVEWLAEEMKEQHGLRVELTSEGVTKPIQADLNDLLFQAVRELLLNVVKHAGAERARVGVHYDGDTLRLTVEDDGAGFDPAVLASRPFRNAGFGLFSIRERLTFSGGGFEITSEPGKGTLATLVVPLEARYAAEEGG